MMQEIDWVKGLVNSFLALKGYKRSWGIGMRSSQQGSQHGCESRLPSCSGSFGTSSQGLFTIPRKPDPLIHNWQTFHLTGAVYQKIEPFVRALFFVTLARAFRLPLALSSGGLNLAQSSTHHGTDNFERVVPSILLFSSFGGLGWFDGCIGVKMEFPSAQVESRPRRKISPLRLQPGLLYKVQGCSSVGVEQKRNGIELLVCTFRTFLSSPMMRQRWGRGWSQTRRQQVKIFVILKSRK